MESPGSSELPDSDASSATVASAAVILVPKRGASKSRERGPHFDTFENDRQEYITLLALWLVKNKKEISSGLSGNMANEQEFKDWNAENSTKRALKEGRVVDVVLDDRMRTAVFSANFNSAKQRGELSRCYELLYNSSLIKPGVARIKAFKQQWYVHSGFIQLATLVPTLKNTQASLGQGQTPAPPTTIVCHP